MNLHPVYRANIFSPVAVSAGPSGVADSFAETIPDRRWPIWVGRLALLAIFAAVAPFLWDQLNDPHGREALLMSGLGFAAAIVIFLLWAHKAMLRLDVPRMRMVRRVATFGGSVVAVGLFLMGEQACPETARSKAVHLPKPLWPLEHELERPAIHHEHVPLLPRFSAKLSGNAQAPVGLIFLGSGMELIDTFTAAGWYVADRVTIETALRAFARGVLNRPYPSAPVLPVFLDGKLHDVAFQKHNEGDSSRRRHHARFWLTDFVVEGKQVWVATASYDAGVGIGRLFPLPIHHIDPDIDAERDYIVGSLTGTGLVHMTQHIQVTEPMVGRNAAGDRFFTSGVACVLA